MQNQKSNGFIDASEMKELKAKNDPEGNLEPLDPNNELAAAAAAAAATANSGSTKPLPEGRKLLMYMATLIAGSSMAQSGMNLGWTAPMLPRLNQTISDFDPEGEEASWLTALMPLGAIVGATPAGAAADRFGRKPVIASTALPFLSCWILMLVAPLLERRAALWSFWVARFVGGIGAGTACVLVPVYVGEVSEPSVRGLLGTFFPIFFSLGIVYSYAAGSYLSYEAFNGSCCALLLPFLLGVFFFIPESPAWLLGKGRVREACASLKVLRGPEHDLEPEIAELLAEQERASREKGGWRDLVGTRAGRRALFTCCGLMWFQQMCGIDAVLFYTVSIFKNAKSGIDPYVATIIIGCIEVVMGVVVAGTIDRFGRKPLLVFSGSAMTICLGVLGYYYRLQEDGNDTSSLNWLPLACIGWFNVVFSLGYGSVPYSIIAELFPPETKGLAGSISIVTNWALVFLVTRTFHLLTRALSESVTFWMFASICAMSAVFAFVYVPETKGKTLVQIQAKLARHKKSHHHHRGLNYEASKVLPPAVAQP
ncbi:hypothetical protein TKK_0005354 [Trichogramma kaykai]|uniref:Major facilitator superfamily (MFS) profile domain-containing protein n=1 Tax=Trichogramma kaykai TaxID=54128 RepID=A0ABD2XJG6_9HYME